MSKITLTKINGDLPAKEKVRCPDCEELLLIGPDDTRVTCSYCESVFLVRREATVETIAERATKAYDQKPPLDMAKEQLGVRHSE